MSSRPDRIRQNGSNDSPHYNDVQKLCKNYAKRMLKVAYRYVREAELAKDAVSNAKLILLDMSSEHFYGINDKGKYFYTIVKNEAISLRKWSKKHILIIDNLDTINDEEENFFNKLFAEKNNHHKIKTVFDSLSSRYSQIIQLFYLRGYTHQEIAETMNIPSLGTSKTTLSRAMKAFRKLFFSFYPDDDPKNGGHQTKYSKKEKLLKKDNNKKIDRHYRSDKSEKRNLTLQSRSPIHTSYIYNEADFYEDVWEGHRMLLEDLGSEEAVEYLLNEQKKQLLEEFSVQPTTLSDENRVIEIIGGSGYVQKPLIKNSQDWIDIEINYDDENENLSSHHNISFISGTTCDDEDANTIGESKEYTNAKILLIGCGSTGKTILARRLWQPEPLEKIRGCRIITPTPFEKDFIFLETKAKSSSYLWYNKLHKNYITTQPFKKINPYISYNDTLHYNISGGMGTGTSTFLTFLLRNLYQDTVNRERISIWGFGRQRIDEFIVNTKHSSPYKQILEFLELISLKNIFYEMGICLMKGRGFTETEIKITRTLEIYPVPKWATIYSLNKLKNNNLASIIKLQDILSKSPEVLDAFDFAFYNIYPYWEHINMGCSINYFHQVNLTIKNLARDKSILVNESGRLSSIRKLSWYKENYKNWKKENILILPYIKRLEELQYYNPINIFDKSQSIINKLKKNKLLQYSEKRRIFYPIWNSHFYDSINFHLYLKEKDTTIFGNWNGEEPRNRKPLVPNTKNMALEKNIISNKTLNHSEVKGENSKSDIIIDVEDIVQGNSRSDDNSFYHLITESSDKLQSQNGLIRH